MKEEQKLQIRLVLRFTPSGKVFSLVIPSLWTIKKLKNFIDYTFKEEIKNSKVNLFYGAKLLTNENAPLSTILNKNEELNQIIINLKSKEDQPSQGGMRKTSLEITINGNPDAARKEIMLSDDFDKLELYIYNCYRDIMKSSSSLAEKEMLHKLPLMHANIDERVKAVNEKSKIGLLANYDPENIENYPGRNFLKIDIFFKLFLFFILFGAHIKGYNIPLFISLLVIYYWYCIYTDINEFYQKKISEHQLTAEELKEIRFLELDEEDEEILEREEEKELERLHKKMLETEAEKASRKNTQTEGEANKIYSTDDIKVENIDAENQIQLSPQNEETKKRFQEEPEDIAHIINKIESKKAKKLEKRQKEEGPIIYVVKFVVEIFYTFIMSLFPMWCDEFEQNNPVIITNQENNQEIPENQQANGNNFENPNLEHLPDNHSHEMEDLNKPLSEQDKHHSQHEQMSEKILIKSSNDTRLVNPSEGQNVKYFLVEENENKTENEFVFSENVNIDTLSYNEPVVEGWKKKHEKEQEEEAKSANDGTGLCLSKHKE